MGSLVVYVPKIILTHPCNITLLPQLLLLLLFWQLRRPGVPTTGSLAPAAGTAARRPVCCCWDEG